MSSILDKLKKARIQEKDPVKPKENKVKPEIPKISKPEKPARRPGPAKPKKFQPIQLNKVILLLRSMKKTEYPEYNNIIHRVKYQKRKSPIDEMVNFINNNYEKLI